MGIADSLVSVDIQASLVIQVRLATPASQDILEFQAIQDSAVSRVTQGLAGTLDSQVFPVILVSQDILGFLVIQVYLVTAASQESQATLEFQVIVVLEFQVTVVTQDILVILALRLALSRFLLERWLLNTLRLLMLQLEHKVYAQTLTSPIMPPRMQSLAELWGGQFDAIFSSNTDV